MFLPCLCLFVIVVLLIVTILFYHGMIKKRKIMLNEEKIALGLKDGKNVEILPSCIHSELNRLVERKFDYIRNYIIFQLANKMTGIASVLFSIMGLISQFVQIDSWLGLDDWLPTCISFFSIVFVILALYLSPSNRVQQYITAWKKCDKAVSDAIAKTMIYKEQLTLLENADENQRKEILNLIKEECQLIRDVIFESEEILSSDSE